MPLNEFSEVHALPEPPAATAATLHAVNMDEPMIVTIQESTSDDPASDDHAMIATIYKPENGYQDSDILNIEMSLDIFGPSTTEVLRIDPRHPTLGFEFHSPNQDARPVIKQCKSGTYAAKMKTWRSRFQHGTIRIHGHH
jgi:hypothetical protein